MLRRPSRAFATPRRPPKVSSAARRYRLAPGAWFARLRLAPQLLEIVVRAHRRLHDVQDDVAEIEQHPVAAVLPFHPVDAAACRFRLFLDVARQRLQLAGGVRARDDHAVEHRGEMGHVEDLDLARLDVPERSERGLLELAKIHHQGAPLSFAYSPCASM